VGYWGRKRIGRIRGRSVRWLGSLIGRREGRSIRGSRIRWLGSLFGRREGRSIRGIESWIGRWLGNLIGRREGSVDGDRNRDTQRGILLRKCRHGRECSGHRDVGHRERRRQLRRHNVEGRRRRDSNCS